MSEHISAIWFTPRRTIREIVDTDPTYLVLLWAGLSGVVRALDRAVARNAGDALSGPVIWGLALVLGPIGGLISMWIMTHLIRWTGKWIGGLADRQQLKAAFAWSAIPVLMTIPITMGQYALVGDDLFRSFHATQWSPAAIQFMFITGLIEIALGVWGLVLFCNTIAEVQQYASAWKGFGNILLAALVIVVPLLAIVAATGGLGLLTR